MLIKRLKTNIINVIDVDAITLLIKGNDNRNMIS